MRSSQINLQHYFRSDAHRFGGVGLWLIFRCLPTLLVACIALLLLSISTARAEEEPQYSLSPNAVTTGEMLLRDHSSGVFTPALMASSKVHFDISGLIATVTVEQTFRNKTAAFVEGVYAFPLPDTAAVRRLEMEIGERRIIGKIREKNEAKKIYQAAKIAGKKASLVEQQRPNLFTNAVANIGPGESVVVKLEYVQTVALSGNLFSLRFPSTITPRYMPGTPLGVHAVSGGEDDNPAELSALTLNPYLGWAQNTTAVPDASAISPLQHPGAGSDVAPIHPVTITATLDMGMPLADVSARYHELALQRRAGVYQIALASGRSEMDRDFVLEWKPVTGSSPKAALFRETVEGEHYGLLMVLPPSAPKSKRPVTRDMTIVVDTSGSMGGVSIEQARASVSKALSQLSEDDFFNVIAFSSNYRKLFPRSVPATANNVRQAQSFVGRLDASGGTEMLPALLAALAPRETASETQERLAQVVFVTDGAVGNERALYAEITKRLGDRRLFTVGIGSAPNSWFMRKAAQFGRGTHTHIGDITEVEQKMAVLFEQLARPAAVDVQVEWPMVVEAWPARVPDLYLGEPLVVAVNFGEAAPSGDVSVTARIDGKKWGQTLRIHDGVSTPESVGHGGVSSVWARKKIAGLLDDIVRGSDEQEVRRAVLPLALKHQLLSPYTSFVAVEDVISRPENGALSSTAIPNVRPRGQAPQTFALPRTATTGPAKAWFGLLCLFVALVVRLFSQREVDHVASE